MEINSVFEEYIGNPLSEYAVDTRYPDIRYIPSKEEMEEAIILMNKIIKEVQNKLK